MLHAESIDQAAGLRQLLTRGAPRTRGTRLLALAAADAGASAPLAMALAAALERLGHATLLLDLSRGGMARAGSLDGRYELMHLIDAAKRLEDIVFTTAEGVPVLPAARGVRALAGAWRGRSRFADCIRRAGRSPQIALALLPCDRIESLSQAAGVAPETLLVVRGTGPGELTGAYSIMKRVRACRGTVRLLFDGPDAEETSTVGQRLQATASEFLGAAPAIAGRMTRGEPPFRAPTAIVALDHERLAHTVVAWPLPEIAATHDAGTDSRPERRAE